MEQEIATQNTEIVYGPEPCMKKVIQAMENTRMEYWVCVDALTTMAMIGTDEFIQPILEMKDRGVKLRFLTEVKKENLENCKAAMKIFEVRHLDGMKTNFFAVTETEYVATSTGLWAMSTKNKTKGGGGAAATTTIIPPLPQLIYSNAKLMVEQQKYLFEILWSKATPAEQKVVALEGGREVDITEFIRDKNSAIQRVVQLISNAKIELLGIGNQDAPGLIMSVDDYRKALQACSLRGVSGRYITDITRSNVDVCKKLMKEIRVNLRHLQGIKSNIAMSERELIADLSPPHPQESSTRLLYSNSSEFLSQQKQLFETLWNKAVFAEDKINEIELGITPSIIEVISESWKTKDTFIELLNSASREILMFIPSPGAFRREEKLGIFDSMEKAAKERGVDIRIVTPRNKEVEQRVGQLTHIRFRIFEPELMAGTKATIVVVDRRVSLAMELKDDLQSDFVNAIGLATYSTSEPTVSSYISFFETLWRETEFREKEERARRQAELLQDILSHDIRNYNQASRMSAELLKLELAKNEGVQFLADSLMRSIDSSTALVDKARQLGKILSEHNAKLCPVNVIESIGHSIATVREAYPEKIIHIKRDYKVSQEQAQVSADSLLDEVFVNLISNSVKYSEGNNVLVEIALDDVQPKKEEEGGNNNKDDPSGSEEYLRVTITDQGIGIPDDLKEYVFTRYFGSKVGSGLGMSIVHGLVVERYHGKIKVKNREEGDYRKGTVVEVYLPKAYPNGGVI